jgi:hypothetical protein
VSQVFQSCVFPELCPFVLNEIWVDVIQDFDKDLSIFTRKRLEVLQVDLIGPNAGGEFQDLGDVE